MTDFKLDLNKIQLPTALQVEMPVVQVPTPQPPVLQVPLKERVIAPDGPMAHNELAMTANLSYVNQCYVMPPEEEGSEEDEVSLAPEEEEGQGRAEQLPQESLQEYKRPSWITADPQGYPNVLWVRHPEMNGRIVMGKPNLRNELRVERIKGEEMGAFPTQAGEQLAEWLAVLMVGLEEVPKDAPRFSLGAYATEKDKEKAPFDPGQLVDPELLRALYEEVSAHWGRFRDSRKAPSTVQTSA